MGKKKKKNISYDFRYIYPKRPQNTGTPGNPVNSGAGADSNHPKWWRDPSRGQTRENKGEMIFKSVTKMEVLAK